MGGRDACQTAGETPALQVLEFLVLPLFVLKVL
jgi:hypothetical protein